MKEGTVQSASKAPAAPRKKGRVLTWLALPVVFLVLGSAAAAGFLYWRARTATAQSEHEGRGAHADETAGVLTLDPFVVNLADSDGGRFVRVHLRLVVAGNEHIGELGRENVRMLRTRSAILELLSTQVATRLVTPEGKSEVKKAIAEQASRLLGVKVTDVLFSEFVVQF